MIKTEQKHFSSPSGQFPGDAEGDMSKMKICRRQLQNTDVKARQELGVQAQVMPEV